MRAALVLVALSLLLVACGTESSGDPAGSEEANGSADALPAEIQFNSAGWATDFMMASVELTEFVGVLGRDSIPPIDEPKFQDIADEDNLGDSAPVVAVALPDEEPRAYPIEILTWHEIVNDSIGDTDLAVTFCPLCNTAVAFNRILDGRELTFGTTGNLRRSDLVMWDRETESWWQQFSGEALVGELTGSQLEVVPSQLISWADFRERYPEGRVLSRDTGVQRDYGENPYPGYDAIDSRPFEDFSAGIPDDDRLPPKERVVTLGSGADFTAIPFSSFAQEPVQNLEIGDEPVVVFWQPGTSSALDASQIADGRDVGSVVVYSRVSAGTTLEFSAGPEGTLRDNTGATWDAAGRSQDGDDATATLTPVAHDTPFWFAVAAFVPAATVASS